jgi:hypothetical protein
LKAFTIYSGGFSLEMTPIRQYRLFNLFMAFALLIVFIYPLLFSRLEAQHQIVCVHKSIIGKPCNSCGITHDFKQFMNGTYMQNHILQNEHSIKVFLFFLSAFLSRFLIALLLKFDSLIRILTLDILWHSVFAFYAFIGFWI